MDIPVQKNQSVGIFQHKTKSFSKDIPVPAPALEPGLEAAAAPPRSSSPNARSLRNISTVRTNSVGHISTVKNEFNKTHQYSKNKFSKTQYSKIEFSNKH
jgi:hypothetical protein